MSITPKTATPQTPFLDLRQKRKGSGVKLVAPRSAHARAKGSIIEPI